MFAAGTRASLRLVQLAPRRARVKSTTSMSAEEPNADFLRIIPALDGSNHKGQHGKVSVIGGNRDFTGAPYFSAYSAMQAGADYGNVCCTPDAAAVIKTYAPELIVIPCMLQLSDICDHWDAAQQDPSEQTKAHAAGVALKPILQWLDKSTCVVVGPGLGTDSIMCDTATRALRAARERDMPIVVDADGLALVMADPPLLRGYRKAILTPNAPEFWRVADALGIKHAKRQPMDDLDTLQKVADSLEGPAVVAKGAVDVVACAGHGMRRTEGTGAPRRCGGQGDILSGIIATTASWACAYIKEHDVTGAEQSAVLMDAVLGAAEVVREAQDRAFQMRGRSLVASDVVRQVGTAVGAQWPTG